MLNEGVAERYDDRPEAFQQAYVDLNEGRAADALPVFEDLVQQAPDDPVGALERGRCLLLLDRFEDAQSDFEAAWRAFGDAPLDAPGALSLPLLWAETAMELKQHEQMVERLAEPAAADKGQPALSHAFALARIELGQLEEVAKHLKACVKAFPREAVFPQLLAQVLVASDDSPGAIETLERAIAPACAGGGCRAPALHVPSVRLLAAILLEQGGATSRARELVELVVGSRRGKLEWEDLALLARCERQDGDESAFARLLAQARALVPPALTEVHAQLDALEASNG
jgi:predicted Zn-dependent protease